MRGLGKGESDGEKGDYVRRRKSAQPRAPCLRTNTEPGNSGQKMKIYIPFAILRRKRGAVEKAR